MFDHRVKVSTTYRHNPYSLSGPVVTTRYTTASVCYDETTPLDTHSPCNQMPELTATNCRYFEKAYGNKTPSLPPPPAYPAQPYERCTYKSRMCVDILRRRKCPTGSSCIFVHCRSEVRTPAENARLGITTGDGVELARIKESTWPLRGIGVSQARLVADLRSAAATKASRPAPVRRERLTPERGSRGGKRRSARTGTAAR